MHSWFQPLQIRDCCCFDSPMKDQKPIFLQCRDTCSEEPLWRKQGSCLGANWGA